MRLLRVAPVLALGGALLSLAVPGVQAQDRPDLLEVGPTSFAINRTDGVDYVSIRFTDTDIGVNSGAQHRQSIRVAHEFPGVDQLLFRIYEPDKVTRKSDQVKWQQNNNLFARILLAAPPTPYNTFTVYGVVTGCKGKAQVTNTSALKYSFGCSNANAVMHQLAVPAGLRPTILYLFGSKF